MALTGRKWLVILNPASGTGRKGGLDLVVQKSLERFGIHAEIKCTGGPGEATAMAAAAASHFETIVAAGGDGTVRETAAGLFGCRTALGILPLGSGNGLARHLGISGDVPTALEQLATADIEATDAYLINGRPGVNVSGIGFDGEIARRFHGIKKRGLGGYVRLILNRFSEYSEFDVEFTENGQTQTVPAFMVCLANGSQFGNNAVVARNADISDGLLNIQIIRKPSWRQLPELFLSVYRGRQHPLIDTRMATEFTLRTNTPQPIHADGDFIEITDRVEIKIMPSALRLLIPGS